MVIRYWDYIRQLIADDEVEFTSREHQGAKDLVNSMLNYGYAILYEGLEDLRKMTIFAPDEIGVFEADFSQESNWRQTRKSFANFWN